MFDLILDLVEDFHTVEERRLHRIFGGLIDEDTIRLSDGCFFTAEKMGQCSGVII